MINNQIYDSTVVDIPNSLDLLHWEYPHTVTNNKIFKWRGIHEIYPCMED
jgi:hypothetical protein